MSLTPVSDPALLERLCDAARPIALQYFRVPSLSAENKDASGFDPVTAADRDIEARLRDILAQERPQDGVLGEEEGRRDGESGRLWVIDPIDGTRAFISGLLNWGVLIALHDGDRPVLGALDQPYVGERFIGLLDPAAAPGPGRATLTRNGETRKLTTRTGRTLSDATLLSTDPKLFTDSFEHTAFERLRAAVKLTRYGTDCYGYAMVAAGAADLVVESGLSAYDVQALIPLVTGAGGVVTTWDGGDAAWGGRILAAGDAALHAAAMDVLAA